MAPKPVTAAFTPEPGRLTIFWPAAVACAVTVAADGGGKGEEPTRAEEVTLLEFAIFAVGGAVPAFCFGIEPVVLWSMREDEKGLLNGLSAKRSVSLEQAPAARAITLTLTARAREPRTTDNRRTLIDAPDATQPFTSHLSCDRLKTRYRSDAGLRLLAISQ